MSGWKDREVDEWDGYMDGGWRVGQVDGGVWMGGWLERQVSGWMDGWMD